MSTRLTAALALAAGLAGGLGSRFIAPPTAHAQAQQQPTREIRAQSVVLVDASNGVIGTFTSETQQRFMTLPNQTVRIPGISRILLRDAMGREIWSAGGSGIRPATER